MGLRVQGFVKVALNLLSQTQLHVCRPLFIPASGRGIPGPGMLSLAFHAPLPQSAHSVSCTAHPPCGNKGSLPVSDTRHGPVGAAEAASTGRIRGIYGRKLYVT
jgi:hypothetical protein